jgi:reverse transcriptase-like protein
VSTAGINTIDRAIEGIRSDLLQAVEQLKANMAEKGQSLGATAMKKLLAGADAYVAKLEKLAQAKPLGMKAQFKLAQGHLLHSYNARFCAMLRVADKPWGSVFLDELHALAKELDIFRPLEEAVGVVWVPKTGKSGYRPIVISDVMRTAQALMLRDVLLVMGIDSAIDCTKKGGGGEKGLIKAVCKDIEDEYHWWWTPDIKDCFGSIKPRHFGWLPIDRRLIRNVAYLPKCAKIVVPQHEDAEAILQYLYAKYPGLSEDGNISLHALTVQVVRRGLLQGSVLSPLLARAVIYREVHDALSHKELKCYSYSDDLSIGAHTKGECRAAKHALTDHLSSLPAGPIELHDVPIKNAATQRIVVLGYALEAGKGHGANYVHVKPGHKRTDKFKRKLFQKLACAQDGADLSEVGKNYWRQWYGSQGAWTKVPAFSKRVSQTITATYVSDFVDGIPLGTWQLNKPPLANSKSA